MDPTRPDPTWPGLTRLGPTPGRVMSCSGHDGETGYSKGYTEKLSSDACHCIDCCTAKLHPSGETFHLQVFPSQLCLPVCFFFPLLVRFTVVVSQIATL